MYLLIKLPESAEIRSVKIKRTGITQYFLMKNRPRSAAPAKETIEIREAELVNNQVPQSAITNKRIRETQHFSQTSSLSQFVSLKQQFQ
jgi:hypothetical protein